MGRPSVTSRSIPVTEQFSPSINDAFEIEFTTATLFVTSQSMDVRPYRKLGFFYNVSATGGGAVTLTYTLQSTWSKAGAAQKAWYDSQGLGNTSAEGPRVEADVSIGRRHLWWNVTAPIVRLKIVATGLAAGESAKINSIKLWGVS